MEDQEMTVGEALARVLERLEEMEKQRDELKKGEQNG